MLTLLNTKYMTVNGAFLGCQLKIDVSGKKEANTPLWLILSWALKVKECCWVKMPKATVGNSISLAYQAWVLLVFNYLWSESVRPRPFIFSFQFFKIIQAESDNQSGLEACRRPPTACIHTGLINFDVTCLVIHTLRLDNQKTIH